MGAVLLFTILSSFIILCRLKVHLRGLFIALSVLLFLLSVRGSRRQLMVWTGWLLFAVGGIVPLVLQLGFLPLILVFASLIEIFFQNFLTGVVAAWLLGVEFETAPLERQTPVYA